MTKSMLSSKYFSPREAADRLRISPKTMSNWRYLGTGPKYTRVGRLIRYPEEEIARYLAARGGVLR